ncbi:MAG: aspartate carbamoyltransferase regulatory subunit [Candidatus Hodarchaeaceae archaeon]|nr:aspartate carbamoyltransferase regulatory subunit [Candidatus Hodarchaeaceae archaeon]
MEKYPKIKNGVTIDHIAPGKALDVLKALGMTPESGNPMVVLINVKSVKMGKKDLVKLENVTLDPAKVVAKVKAIAPKATVNLIKNYEVVKKVRA